MVRGYVTRQMVGEPGTAAWRSGLADDVLIVGVDPDGNIFRNLARADPPRATRTEGNRFLIVTELEPCHQPRALHVGHKRIRANRGGDRTVGAAGRTTSYHKQLHLRVG